MNKIRRKNLQTIIDRLEDIKADLEEITYEEEEFIFIGIYSFPVPRIASMPVVVLGILYCVMSFSVMYLRP